MSILPHDPPPAEPPPRSPLQLVKPDRAPPVVDTAVPIRPEWLRDRVTFTSTTRVWRRRAMYLAGRWAWHAPAALLMLVLYSPRGLARVTAALGRWVYDQDSAEIRHRHAQNIETAEYARVHAVRKANLHARALVLGTGALVGLGPVLAWTYPHVLAGIVGAVVAFWVIKIIPGKHWGEFVVAAGAGVAVWWFLPSWLAQVPRPPVWAVWVAAVAAVAVFGWLGRTRGKPLAARAEVVGPGAVVPLRAPMVREALCSLGIGGMRDPDTIRLLADVHRHGPGVQVDVELPGGVAASEVVRRREKLAAALKRELGCVWPSVGRRNAAHLGLYVSDEPLVAQRQKPWPLTDGDAIDIFKPQPLVTDQRGEWISLTLAYAAVVIGAQPRMGKTFLLRQLLLIAGLDPRTKVASLDGKGTGDLAPTRLFADFYSVGDDPDEVEDRVLPFLRGLRDEMRRRAKFIRDLPYAECPESKVTSALVSKHRHLAPWIVGIDETQSYFSYGGRTDRDHKAIREELADIVTDLVRRGPALGMWVSLATQNVSETTIPRPISLNAVLRFALKVFDDSANNMVLGSGAYGRGVDATAFDFSDKGVMWVRGDDGDPFIGRSVAGLDAPRAEALAAKARALREAAGTLSGDAAGDDDDQALDLIDDVRAVLDTAGTGRMHLAGLVEQLQARRPTLYGSWDAAGLGAALRGRGVDVADQLKIAGRNSSGVRREALPE